MALNLSLLDPTFASRVQQLLDACKQRNVEMRPYCTLRNPFDQAKLWRQSRSSGEITQKIQEFNDAGATFLAYCIQSVGPQYGDPATNAPPGLSWHQWGEAVDSFWVVSGHAEWSARKLIDGINGYQVCAEEAAKLALTPGGFWKSFKDWPHVQWKVESSPARIMPILDIDSEMKRRFGD
jgi:peptidoglycan LD-endopeptidase CwlK